MIFKSCALRYGLFMIISHQEGSQRWVDGQSSRGEQWWHDHNGKQLRYL
jgi:hypothetical protein